MNWITKNISNFFSDLISGMLEALGEFLNSIFVMVVELNNVPEIDNVCTYTVLLGLTLLAILAIKQGIDTYALQTNGDADSDPIELITRVAKAAAIIMCNGWIFNELLTISGLVTTDFMSSITNNETFTGHVENLMGSISATSLLSGVIWIIAVFALIIAIIIFVISAGIRGAELVLFKILLPIFAIDIINTNNEKWNSFFTSYMVSMFGYGLQLFSFQMFVVQFLKVGFGDVLNLIVVFGWIVLMIRAPKWLEKFVYSSGVGSALKGGGRTAMVMVPSLIRK